MKKLAHEDKVKELESLITFQLAKLEAEDDPDQEVERPCIERPPVLEWSSGVEALDKLSEDELWERLGLAKQKHIPFFNVKLDPDGCLTPWDNTAEAKAFFESDRALPLTLRHHQLVGIFRLLELGFDGQPVLLMDEVGLGKTIQVTGYLALLAYFRAYYERRNVFPGDFSTYFKIFFKSLLILRFRDS